jgi:hypothetical protein
MKFNLRALAFAAAALAAGGAQADFNFPPTGNGTLLFVAIDKDANIAFTADLGLTVTSFTEVDTFTSGLAAPVTWNFATNATNSGIAGTNAWDAAYSTFTSTQTGGNFLWGVIAGDNISGTVAGSAFNRNVLATGNATQDQMLAANTSTPTSTMLTNLGNFSSAVNNFGNLAAVNTNGAATTNSANDVAWLDDDSMQHNYGGLLTWSYLLQNGVSSTFQRQQQAQNPLVTQFGNPNAVDSLSANPITFTFDIATNTLVLAAAPIPEPGTYAMLLAGLSAVGFMVRRRKA